MVRSSFHIVLLICSVILAKGQDISWKISADSLKAIVSKSTSDQQKIDALHHLSEILPDEEKAQAFGFSQQALSISLANDDAREIVRSYTNLGNLYGKFGEHTRAISFYYKAIRSSPSEKPFVAPTWFELGRTYRILSRPDSAEKALRKGLAINESRKDPTLEAALQNMLAEVAKDAKKFDVSVAHFVKAVEALEKIDDKPGLVKALLNAGDIHCRLGNYGLALEYTEQSLRHAGKINQSLFIADAWFQQGSIYTMQRRLDAALNSYSNSIRLYRPLGAMRETGEASFAMGSIHFEKGDLTSGMNAFQDALTIAQSLNNPEKLARTYIALAKTAFELKDYNKCITFLDSAENFATLARLPYVILDIREYQGKVSARRGSFQAAYESIISFNFLRDSLSSEENRITAGNEEARSKEEKSSGDLLLQQASAEVDRLRSEKDSNQRNYLVALAGVAFILIIVLYNRYVLNLKWKLRLRELDKVKARFYTNLSEEFKSPLALITGPLQRKAREAKTQNEKEEFEALSEHAYRLTTIINQLLDLSKLESGSMHLQIREDDISQALRVIATSFSSFADHKGIRYKIDIEAYSGPAYFDIDKVERVLINLLSNAFKFTPAKGSVSIRASVVNQHAVIFVKDTGKGISQDQLPFIFNRFYQVDDLSKRFQEGSGIGLALCKELTELHHGTLTVESEEGQGSEFVFTIPISRSAYRKAEVVKSDKTTRSTDITYLKDKAIRSSGELPEDGVPLILIAEENEDMRLYIANTLRLNYRVIGVDDGQEALDKALQIVPDIIVADVNMPGMDGRMICHNVKSTMPTSHIPVVMLTARADQELKYEGAHLGADDYLTKPFDARELLMRVHNLIQQRRLHQDLFRQQMLQFSEYPALPPSEHQFLSTLMDALERNYANHTFGVDQLTEHVLITRMQLHRKLKALSNKSPGEFLRLFRLEKAKQFLGDGLSVNEVAFKTGFNHHSTFSKAFKEFVGATPSDFASKLKTEDSQT
jgi:signal transduction histidine kinase/DNA-binding response OmpR family regulator/lipopolysaccharide biosynthesis regulator YciM